MERGGRLSHGLLVETAVCVQHESDVPLPRLVAGVQISWDGGSAHHKHHAWCLCLDRFECVDACASRGRERREREEGKEGREFQSCTRFKNKSGSNRTAALKHQHVSVCETMTARFGDFLIADVLGRAQVNLN